jgi:hypothetical protein
MFLFGEEETAKRFYGFSFIGQGPLPVAIIQGKPGSVQWGSYTQVEGMTVLVVPSIWA